MSAPLSSGKDRNATAPLAANSDSNHAKALDILDELQRALDETRFAGAAHQSPPLQPSGEENSPVKDDGAPQWRSPYAPKVGAACEFVCRAVGRAASEAEPHRNAWSCERDEPRFSRLCRRTGAGREGRGAARARGAPGARIHEGASAAIQSRISTDRARRHPLAQGAPNGSAAPYAGPGADDEEVLLRILQPKHQPVLHNQRNQADRGTRRWAKPVGVLAATALAGGLGFFIYQFVGSSKPDANSTVRLQQVASLSSTVHKTQDSRAPRAMTKLVLSDVSGSSNRPVALGVNIEAASPGSFVVIRGLQSGSRVTAGNSVGEGVWRIPMRELANAAVMPPHDFVGTMNLSVDLRRSDESLVDSDVQRITWTADAPTPAVAKAVKTTMISPSADVFPPPPPPPASAAAPRTVGLGAPLLDPHEQAQTPASRRLDPNEDRAPDPSRRSCFAERRHRRRAATSSPRGRGGRRHGVDGARGNLRSRSADAVGREGRRAGRRNRASLVPEGRRSWIV